MRLEACTVLVLPRTWQLTVWLAVGWKPPGIQRAGQPRFGSHSRQVRLLTTSAVSLWMALSSDCRRSGHAVTDGI